MAPNPNACALITKGRGLDCNRISGGIKNIYFGVFDTTKVTTDWTSAQIVGNTGAGTVTDITMDGATKLFRYSLPRGTASFTDTLVGSRENGTIFYTPTIQMMLDKLDSSMLNQMRLLGATQTVIFAELNQVDPVNPEHNVIVCLGAKNGMQLNAGTDASGAALGDKNGFDLTFDGLEAFPASIVIDYTNEPFDNIDSGGAIGIISA
tara:strand:- start:19561 stop:20181 length:621 start_codon:yes stop_codon:yes gene_type:complete